MPTPISNAAITRNPIAQTPAKTSFSSLPLEIQDEIENQLDHSNQQSWLKALTTVTRDGEPVDDIALQLFLIQHKIRAKHQAALVKEALKDFSLRRLQRLSESSQLAQVVTQHAFFNLVRRFFNDPELVGFLQNKVQEDTLLQQNLLSWAERSKTEDVQTEAANALTLLVRAGVQLNNKDFGKIRVPGADLSYGVFDSTKFQNADLSDVDLTCAWLRDVNLDGANLANLQLGERPSLTMQGWVFGCAYSPDGRWLAVTEENQIELYDAENLINVHTFTGHQDKVTSIEFSNDGQWLASSGNDGTAKLWQVSGDRHLEHTYTVPGRRIYSIAFSSDGQWLASGGDAIRLWQALGDRSLAHTYEGDGGLVFSNNGQWLASNGEDGTVKLWHVLGDRSLAHTYDVRQMYIYSLAFSSDSQWLASAGDDGTVKLWHVSGDRSLAHTYEVNKFGGARGIAFSNDGQWLASGGGHLHEGSSGRTDYRVKLWHVSGDRSLEHTSTERGNEVRSVAFSNDGRWLASADFDGVVKQSRISGDRFLTHSYAKHTDEITEVAFSGDGRWLALARRDGVALWHASGDRSLAHTYPITTSRFSSERISIAFSNDGQWLVSADRRTLQLWHVLGDRSLAHTYSTTNRFSSAEIRIALSNDGQWLASTHVDKVKLWHVLGDRSLAHTYIGHEEDVIRIAFSHDGQWLASGSSDGAVKLWHVSGDRSFAHTYNNGDESGATSIAFSNNGQWLASANWDNEVRLWHVSGDRSLVHTYSHTNVVDYLAFSNDDRWLASTDWDGTVRLWSVLTGECQTELQNFMGRDAGSIQAIAWESMQENSAMLRVATNNIIYFWKVSFDSDRIDSVILDWTSRQDELIAEGALIGNARNLTPQNAALLIQQGAIQNSGLIQEFAATRLA